MFVLRNPAIQRYPALCCVWIPAHTGAHAPLHAVWILSDTRTAGTGGALQAQDAELSLDSPDLWLFAA